MRHVLNNDDKWRSVLRGLNQEFWHKTIGTAKFEAYMSRECGFDFGLFFDQYLRTTKIPVLMYEGSGLAVEVWWSNVVSGFEVPVVLIINGEEQRVTVTEGRTKISLDRKFESLKLDRNFFMTTKAL